MSRDSPSSGDSDWYNSLTTSRPSSTVSPRNAGLTYPYSSHHESQGNDTSTTWGLRADNVRHHQATAQTATNSPIIATTTPIVRGAGAYRSQLFSPDSASAFQRRTDIPMQHNTSEQSSPASLYAPQLTLTEAENQPDDEEGYISTGSEAEEGTLGIESSKSGAERLAAKRKMKRFRLTHPQTRYLMSEFARQAHPDSAHRERLASEIQGLTPRKVQVWFQNRRAKLKRLTSDDQERMMTSRALPADFDFANTLQPSLGERRPSLRPTSPSSHPTSAGSGMGRRPQLNQSEDQQSFLPNNMASLFTNLDVGSPAGSANLSPVSSFTEGSQYSGSQSPLMNTPQTFYPYGRSNSVSTGFTGQQRQSEQLRQSNMNRLRASSLASPGPPNSGFAGQAYNYRESIPAVAVGASFSSEGHHYAGDFSNMGTLSYRSEGIQTQGSVSPSTSPIPQVYNQGASNFPSTARSAGTHSSSYPNQIDAQSWQSRQTALERGPSGYPSQVQGQSPYLTTPNQYMSYQGAAHPERIASTAQGLSMYPSQPSFQQSTPPLEAAASRTVDPQQANKQNRRRGSGNTYPSYYGMEDG